MLCTLWRAMQAWDAPISKFNATQEDLESFYSNKSDFLRLSETLRQPPQRCLALIKWCSTSKQGAASGFLVTEHGAGCSGWVTSCPNLLHRPILSVSHSSHIFSQEPSEEEHWGQCSGENVPHSHQPGSRASCPWELPDSQGTTVRMCWQGNLSTCRFHSRDSSACSTSQATKDSRPHLTVQQPCPWAHTHTANELETWKGQRYHGIQMRAFKLETQQQPYIVSNKLL